jgi:hypothetical protein
MSVATGTTKRDTWQHWHDSIRLILSRLKATMNHIIIRTSPTGISDLKRVSYLLHPWLCKWGTNYFHTRCGSHGLKFQKETHVQPHACLDHIHFPLETTSSSGLRTNQPLAVKQYLELQTSKRTTPLQLNAPTSAVRPVLSRGDMSGFSRAFSHWVSRISNGIVIFVIVQCGSLMKGEREWKSKEETLKKSR